MKKLTSIVFIFFTLFAQAQKEANMWYFGGQAALDFNSGSPVVLLNSAMTSFEGVSSIADFNGNLLFYTNGATVWNANHVIMPNGTGLFGTDQSTQSCLIVQQPNSPNLYYIFTTDAFSGANGFEYHVVDMSLNGGLGDVSIKNQMLYTPTNERVSGCTHGNGTDVWILSHQTVGNGFVAYRLTPTGLNLTPVISNAGPMFTGGNLDFLGYMKFSPKGDRVAIAESAPDNFWLFDFDASTGIVSNPIQLNTINSTEGAYGVEFSSDGHVLYGTEEIPFLLYQWDITSGNAATINASRITIPTQPLGAAYIGSLQLGPDRKIYMTRNTCGYLGVINDPNVIGMGCNYVDSGVYLQGRTCVYGLPNLNQSFYTNFHIPDVCIGDSTHFVLDNSTGLLGAAWDFGDPGSGLNNYSTNFNPVHLYATPGAYQVQVIKYYLLYTDTLTLTANVLAYPSFDLGVDTTFCTGSSYLLNPGGGYTSYLWQDGSTDSIFTASVSGIYYVTLANGICASSDTINLTDVTCATAIASLSCSDTSFCEKNCVDFYDLSTNNPTSWQWFFPGADSLTSNVQNPTGICYNSLGSFDVILIACNALGCDTLTLTNFINEYPNPVDSIWSSNDTLYSMPADNYQWYELNGGLIPGATNQFYVFPPTPGTYYCVVSDSIGCIATSNIMNLNTSGLHENSEFGLTISPNPTNGSFEITFDNYPYTNQITTCKIYDMVGKIVYETEITNQKTTLNLDVKNGIYFIQLKNNEMLLNQKLMIKK